MTIKNKLKKAGLITLASLVGVMPLMAREIPVSSEQQQKYEKLQKGRLDRQIVRSYNIEDGRILSPYIGDNLITASFIDVACGNNDWETTIKEREDFLNQSEGNNVFYAVVRGINKKYTTDVDNKKPYTNNPVDYVYNLTTRNVFATKEGAERKIQMLKQREQGSMSPRTIDSSPLEYFILEIHRSDDEKPLRVTSLFRQEKDEFVKEDVLGYNLNSQRAYTYPDDEHYNSLNSDF